MVTWYSLVSLHLVFLTTSVDLSFSVWQLITPMQYLMIFTVIQLVLSNVPSHYYRDATSFIGNMSFSIGASQFLFALSCILLIAIVMLLKSGIDANNPVDLTVGGWLTFAEYPSFFGIICYVFFAPAALFSISNEMKYPGNFLSVVSRTYFLVVVFSMVFAMVTFLLFGEKTLPLSIMNMCDGSCVSFASQVVQVMMVVNVVFTYPLMVAPLLTFSPPGIPPIISRSAIVLITSLAAGTLSQISLLVDLTSGVAVTFNSFVVIPVLYLVSHSPLYGQLPIAQRNESILQLLSAHRPVILLLHSVLIFGGIYSGLAATYEAIVKANPM